MAAYLPVDQGFAGSELLLPTAAGDGGNALLTRQWDENALLVVIGLVSLVAAILLIRNIINILPYLIGCAWRWKENVNLEDSTKLCRDRDAIFILSCFPFCLIAADFRLWGASFTSRLGQTAEFLVTAGVFLVYLGLRFVTHKFVRPSRISSKMYRTAANTFRTFFITITVTILTTAGICGLFNASADVVRSIILWETGVLYFISLLRKSQIFASGCTIFSTILYLCALEILPTGLLVASALTF